MSRDMGSSTGMFDPGNERHVFVFAEALVRDCVLVAQVADEVLPLIGNAPRVDTETEVQFQAVFSRCVRWSRTVLKLSNVDDFQAAVGASRALLEMAIDLTLLHFDRRHYPAARLSAWEESAKLKSAARIERYYRERKTAVPSHFAPQVAFLYGERARIEALRVEHFGNKNDHPQRWTGKGRSLETDALDADSLSGGCDLMPLHLQRSAMPYAEVYAQRWDAMCWLAHGSGLTGVRGMAEHHLPLVGAYAMNDCANFIVRICELILREFQLWTGATVERFDALKDSRIRVFIEHAGNELPEIRDLITGLLGAAKQPTAMGG